MFTYFFIFRHLNRIIYYILHIYPKCTYIHSIDSFHEYMYIIHIDIIEHMESCTISCKITSEYALSVYNTFYIFIYLWKSNFGFGLGKLCKHESREHWQNDHARKSFDGDHVIRTSIYWNEIPISNRRKCMKTKIKRIKHTQVFMTKSDERQAEDPNHEKVKHKAHHQQHRPRHIQ